MGFMQAMKSANNAWARLTSKDGWGYLGPENLIDNRSHNLLISIGTTTKVVSRNDIASVQTIACTSEWAKFRIILKDKSEYTASFLVTTTTQKGRDFSAGLLNFEFWMDGLIYKENYAASSTLVMATPPTSDNPTQPVATTSAARASITASKNAKTLSKKSILAQLYDPVEEQEENASEKELLSPAQDEEKEQLYQFSLQMIAMHSYYVAYNSLIKIKGYKDVDSLIEQIKGLI